MPNIAINYIGSFYHLIGIGVAQVGTSGEAPACILFEDKNGPEATAK